jgi:3-oxoadipate enol-lactonase
VPVAATSAQFGTRTLRYLEARPAVSARPRGVLVLLHAFALNARMWESQFRLAEDGWRIVAPQYRRSDGGDDEPGAASLDDYAADVIDLLDALHVEDAAVAGLSMGGYVAFALLRLAPRYVRALVLADTRPQADSPEALEGRDKILALVRDRGVAAVADELLPKLLSEKTRRDRPDIVNAVRSLILSNGPMSISDEIHAMKRRPDSSPLLAGIHVPTLVVVGTADEITPPAVAEQMRAAIGGSELVVIPDAGHLSNLEQPRAFDDALARFLAHRV